MLKIYLHDFGAIIEPNEKRHNPLLAWIPSDVLAMLRAIEQQIVPDKESKEARQEANAVLQDIGEPIPPEPAEEVRLPGTFDRTPLTGLVDWCQENEEPWLEKACRFLVRHTEIRIERYSYYSGCWRWRFVRSSMPERWRDVDDSAHSLMGLICTLAQEIRDRLEAVSS